MGELVDARRAQYARAFRKASRDLLDAKRAAGDLTGAIEAAEHWIDRNPLDDEAQHRLIEALAAAGERAEAIRQYETYVRALEPDGLQPLDETVALVDRLRSDIAPLPSLKTPAPAAVPDPVAALPSALHADEPTASGQPKSRRPLRLIAAAVIVLVLLVASAWALRRRQVEGTSPMDATTIAVLPFSVHGAPAAEYLSEGIVNLLGAALDGAGALRPVDTRAVMAAVGAPRPAAPDREQGDRVATRLGAGLYVLGDVVEAGGQLQIEAAVYHAATDCESLGSSGARAACRAREPNARATVSGAADSVFELVDRLAARLLGGLGDPAADRLLRTAALTTSSLTAFKSYLQGEGLMRAGQFEQAADDYLAAIAQDSTFALAHYRLALAREWAPLAGEDSAASAAARHGDRLSTRDHQLLEAFREWRSGDAAAAERAYRSILARYPDDIDAWFQLGEILFHHGPLFGRPIAASEEAWRKVLSYEIGNLFAITHLTRIAVIERRNAAVDSLLAPFPAAELRTDRRLAELVLLRAVARGDTVTAHAIAKDVRRWEPFAVWRVAAFLTAFTPDAAIMRTVMTDLTEDLPSPGQRADLHWFASLLELASGRTGTAESALADAVAAERTVPAEHRRQGFQEVTEWFTATLPLPYADSMLVRARQQVLSRRLPAGRKPPFVNAMGIGTPIQLEPLRQYTLGILAVRLRDSAAAEVAATNLHQLATLGGAIPLVRDLDRGLRAQLTFLGGHPDQALKILETLESKDTQGDVMAIPFVSRANERFLRGEVLAALGRNAEALQWFGSLGDGSVTEIPLRAVSHLRQAEIYEHLANREKATLHYTRLVELWRDADPEFRQSVHSAQRRLAILGRPD